VKQFAAPLAARQPVAFLRSPEVQLEAALVDSGQEHVAAVFEASQLGGSRVDQVGEAHCQLVVNARQVKGRAEHVAQVRAHVAQAVVHQMVHRQRIGRH